MIYMLHGKYRVLYQDVLIPHKLSLRRTNVSFNFVGQSGTNVGFGQVTVYGMVNKWLINDAPANP